MNKHLLFGLIIANFVFLASIGLSGVTGGVSLLIPFLMMLYFVSDAHFGDRHR